MQTRSLLRTQTLTQSRKSHRNTDAHADTQRIKEMEARVQGSVKSDTHTDGLAHNTHTYCTVSRWPSVLCDEWSERPRERGLAWLTDRAIDSGSHTHTPLLSTMGQCFFSDLLIVPTLTN